MELALGRMELMFLQMRVEIVRTETHVNESIEKIKKGLDKFFSRYATQVERETTQAETGLDEIEEIVDVSQDGSTWGVNDVDDE